VAACLPAMTALAALIRKNFQLIFASPADIMQKNLLIGRKIFEHKYNHIAVSTCTRMN
jgi:hypothetical protein